MKTRDFIAALVSASLLVAPMAANAAERTPSPVAKSDEIAGNPWIPILIGLIVAGLIVWQVVDDDEPASP